MPARPQSLHLFLLRGRGRVLLQLIERSGGTRRERVRSGVIMVMILSCRILGRLLLLDDILAIEVDLGVGVAGDDIVPLGKAIAQLFGVLLAGGHLGVVFLLPPLVFLLDLRPLSGQCLGGERLLGGLLLDLLLGRRILLRLLLLHILAVRALSHSIFLRLLLLGLVLLYVIFLDVILHHGTLLVCLCRLGILAVRFLLGSLFRSLYRGLFSGFFLGHFIKGRLGDGVQVKVGRYEKIAVHAGRCVFFRLVVHT